MVYWTNFSKPIWQANNVLPEPAAPANRVIVLSNILAFADFCSSFNCNLNLFGNFDEDEKYRITKKVYVNQKEYTLYADFTVN